MTSIRNQNLPSSFPAVPPSLSAGDHEMRDYYAAQETPRPAPNAAPYITPYLGLRARLSQVWINRWTTLLLLVLVRTLIAVSGLNHDLDSARREALSACSGVESMGSAMASMPHYMSHGVNELAASGVERAVNGLMSMLLLSVTGVEEIVLFVINLLTSTYVCLITLAVSGSLHVAVQVAEDVTQFLNKTLGEIGTDIHKDVKSFEDDLNKFTSVLNSIPQAFGSHSAIPKLNIDNSLNRLDDLQLPASVNKDLEKLNSSIPTFAQINNFTNSAIRLPFEEVKKLLNQSMGTFHFDRSVFPVPQKEQLTFCSDNNGINDFFDELRSIANLARKIFIGVLIVLAILACIPMAYREIRRWRTIQQRAQLISQNSFDPLDVVYIASRPYTSTAGMKAANGFQTTRRQILVRWVVAYGTSAPALFVLSLGLAGLLACLCQYILLKIVEKEVPALVNQVGGFADKVVGVLNNASEQWAIGTNQVIASTNKDINHDVFGWVNTTTGAVNETLNLFVDGMTEALNVTFGGTVLYDPITEVLNCLIGLKIAGVQKGLDWISDHAKVDFPNLPNNTFSLGAVSSIASENHNASNSFLAAPNNEATDKITNAVVTMTNHIASAIRDEAIISSCVLLVWFIIVMSGVLRALTLWFGRDKTRGEGGPDYSNQDYFGPARPSSPSPAYQRTEPDHAPAGSFPAFGAPEPAVRRGPSVISEEEWQDEKLGFAGQRPAPPIGLAHLRSSSYGHVVDEKR